MKKEIFFKAIPVDERQPREMSSIHVVLLDGRLPMMAQWNPQGWCYLSGIPATKEPQLIGGKGVSHWLEKQNFNAPETENYPPIVRAVLAIFECLPENEIEYSWASVSITGTMRQHLYKPKPVYGSWEPEKWGSIVCDLPMLVISLETAASLLFHRTESGWVWVGKPQ